MVSTISLIAGGYFVAYGVLFTLNRKTLSKLEKRTFTCIFAIIVITTIVQVIVPWLLLTSMSVAIMAVNVFSTFENPREYSDIEVEDALNKSAFLTMINEYVESKQEFYIVSLVLTNSKLLKDAKGYMATLEYVESAALYLKKYANTDLVYHPKRDWVSLIFADKKKYYAFMEEQREVVMQERNNEHGPAKFTMNILKCPEFAKDVDEIVKVLDYVDKIKKDIKENIFRIDENVLEDKRKFSRIERVVQNAIDNDGFEVHYQPIYSNKKKAYVSAEALVRLRDDETMKYISPDLFIPIAEENGMTVNTASKYDQVRIVFTAPTNGTYALIPVSTDKSGQSAYATGNSNYMIYLENKGKPAFALAMMDSNGCHTVGNPIAPEEGVQPDNVDYDLLTHQSGIYPDQVAWYRQAVQGLPNAIFMHIQMHAFYKALQERYGYVQGVDVATDREGDVGFYPEHMGEGSFVDPDHVLFNAAREADCRAIFAGHQHRVDCMVNWQGVTLGYGLKTGYCTYWRGGATGGTLHEISADGAIKSTHVYRI
jgi:hypothetical protein